MFKKGLLVRIKFHTKIIIFLSNIAKELWHIISYLLYETDPMTYFPQLARNICNLFPTAVPNIFSISYRGLSNINKSLQLLPGQIFIFKTRYMHPHRLVLVKCLVHINMGIVFLKNWWRFFRKFKIYQYLRMSVAHKYRQHTFIHKWWLKWRWAQFIRFDLSLRRGFAAVQMTQSRRKFVYAKIKRWGLRFSHAKRRHRFWVITETIYLNMRSFDSLRILIHPVKHWNTYAYIEKLWFDYSFLRAELCNYILLIVFIWYTIACYFFFTTIFVIYYFAYPTLILTLSNYLLYYEGIYRTMWVYSMQRIIDYTPLAVDVWMLFTAANLK